MYAIIRSGNKQYQVREGDRIEVERLPHQPGEEITFAEVLLFSDGDKYEADKKALGDITVTARVLDEHKGRKVIAFDYRNKHRRRTTRGHRQLYTRLEITGIKRK